MGTYTTVTDVKSLFRRIKIESDTGTESTNTVLTTEEVEKFIGETELAVESRLSTYYTGTHGTNSKKIIGTIVKYKVAQIIKNVMALKTSDSDTVKQDTYNWEKMANDLLNQIAPMLREDRKDRPSMPLPDSSLKNEPPTGSALFAAPETTRIFTKDGPNW